MSHSWRDPDAPDESVQVIVGGGRLFLTVEVWLDRIELAKPHVISWVSVRVHLEGAKRPGRTRTRGAVLARGGPPRDPGRR